MKFITDTSYYAVVEELVLNPEDIKSKAKQRLKGVNGESQWFFGPRLFAQYDWALPKELTPSLKNLIWQLYTHEADGQTNNSEINIFPSEEILEYQAGKLEGSISKMLKTLANIVVWCPIRDCHYEGKILEIKKWYGVNKRYEHNYYDLSPLEWFLDHLHVEHKLESRETMDEAWEKMKQLKKGNRKNNFNSSRF